LASKKAEEVTMKIAAKFLLMLLIASIVLPGLAAATNEIPELGGISAPANTTDVTEGLGIFSSIGKFAIDYAIHFTVFFAVMVIIVLNARGSWARSNQRSEEAAESRRNVKEAIMDNIWTIVALMVVFYIFSPFIKSFIQG
jgi:hypothetical protein